MTRIKTLTIICIVVIFTACTMRIGTEKLTGHAYIVDNFKDKNPLEGVYIEVEYTTDEGYTYDFLVGETTDENGFFEIDVKYKNGLIGFDSWARALVYSDTEYSDTLGSFQFYFPENTYRYKTIYLDTFSLSHNIWVVPRIVDLGNFQPDELIIHFQNCELTDKSLANQTFSGPVFENQVFEPVEIVMDMLIQHWITFGTREFARGSLKKNANEIGFGYFKLEEGRPTSEGDTVYLDFRIFDENSDYGEK